MTVEQSRWRNRIKLSPHLLCLVLPVYAFGFLISGPHPIGTALLWIIPVWMTVIADLNSPQVSQQTTPEDSTRRFDAILYVLAALQIVNIALLLNMASQLGWSSSSQLFTSLCNLFAIKIVVGTSSSFSGLVVAHELIHRSQTHFKVLGRLLLVLECYEHFATEHIRGHHRNVGTEDDPATAYLGESFKAFWRRTVPAQFKSAWQLENQRLGLKPDSVFEIRLFQHRVLQGLLVELGLVVSIFSYFGTATLIAFAVQAYAAVHKLETVNYIQHWGLSQCAKNQGKNLSWDTDSWFTLYTLIGLSRHTDHHLACARAYPQLSHHPESPKLPYGYFAMVFLTVFNNSRFQIYALRELESRGLVTESIETKPS